MNEPQEIERNTTADEDDRAGRILNVLVWIGFIVWSWVAITFTFRAFFG